MALSRALPLAKKWSSAKLGACLPRGKHATGGLWSPAAEALGMYEVGDTGRENSGLVAVCQVLTQTLRCHSRHPWLTPGAEHSSASYPKEA